MSYWLLQKAYRFEAGNQDAIAMNNMDLQTPEETLVCQFCKLTTPADFNFCIECDNQIKCINCGKRTFPGKSYCLACAQPLVERPATNQAPNQYERNVKQDGDKYEEHTKFSLSDNAVHEIAPFIINQTMPGTSPRPISKQPAALSNGSKEDEETVDTTYEDATPQKQPDSEDTDLISKEQNNTNDSTSATKDFNSPLKKYFEYDGDGLIIIENDFKGQNWTEQQKNFILLYTKAYKDLLNKVIPGKETYKELAVKLKLADPNNFTRHISKQVSAYMSQTSNGLILNAAGEKEVAKIIALMNDDSKAGYAYWSRPINAPKQQSHLSKDDREKVTLWVTDSGEIDLGQLDIRDISKARDYAALSLWIIIHKLDKVNAVKWNEALLFLTSKYQTISINNNAFSKSLFSKEGKKFFNKNNEGLYYLTTVGQQLVEDWISGIKSIKKESSIS